MRKYIGIYRRNKSARAAARDSGRREGVGGGSLVRVTARHDANLKEYMATYTRIYGEIYGKK